MTKYCIGIDPGIKGAIAVCDGPELVAVFDMPLTQTVQSTGKVLNRVDPVALVSIFAAYPTERIAIERVHARPGEGVTSSFNFGFNAAVVETVAALTGTEVVMVTPQTWKRTMALSGDKNLSRALATEKSGKVQPFKRKKDDGRAEAYLLAQWAMEVE